MHGLNRHTNGARESRLATGEPHCLLQRLTSNFCHAHNKAQLYERIKRRFVSTAIHSLDNQAQLESTTHG